MSWCAQDPDLLLSSGKDNRTICWNPQTGENYGELPIVTNWTFQTRWNPHNPSFFATASFDGKITVQTIQNTSKEAAQVAATQNQALDGEDFFARAQTQPQAATFSLPKTPKWLERPVSASFGFGGRVISVGLNDSTNRTSKVRITPFQVDSTVGSAAEGFETALKEGNLKSICQSRIESASTEEEKSDWKVIENLLSENPRKGLAAYLGFSDDANGITEEVNKLEIKGETNDEVEQAKGDAKKKHKRLQSIFDTSGDSDNFLTDLGASKGAQTNNPFNIYSGGESEADKAITRALLLGQFERALDVALQEDRLSDAFMIAVCGGDKCIEKVQEVYFSKQTGGPNYVRLLSSIAGKNLWDVVHNADLSNWKEIMATLCTFADEKEFPDLCEVLGDRLEEQAGNTADKSVRKDASFCYLAGSKLEKVVTIWLEEFKEGEKQGIDQAQEGSSFSVHVRALQAFVEKVTVFRQVTNYQDADRQKDADWKLAVLYDKYIEYADVAASHGHLDVADRYLGLVPDKYDEADAARNRIRLATRKAPAVAAKAATQVPQARASSLPQPNIYQPPQPTFSPAPPVSNIYAPTNTPPPAAPANPYASFGANPYQPSGGYQPVQAAKPQVAPPPQQFGVPPPGPGGVPPPPRVYNQSPSGPQVSTYTTRTDLPAWNDLPEGFGFQKPTSRRGTPAAVASPFSGQQQPTVGSPNSPPIGPPPVGGQRAPPPPPPKAGVPPPPRITSPPVAPPRAPSVSSNTSAPLNAYAPPAIQSPTTLPGMALPPPIPRGPSPYNAPPTGPPPTNRYAPSPAVQQAAPQTRPPPSGPYAPQQPAASSSPYAPVAGAAPIPQAGPPPTGAAAGPPPATGSRPGTSQSQTQKKSAPPPPKYRKFIKSYKC
jgi:protein transport protein SEC31